MLNTIDMALSVEWAQDIMAGKENYLILDTETTGLTKRDVVIQVAIIDLEGNILLNSLIKPTKKKYVPSAATAIHSIKTDDLRGKPSFSDILPKFKSIVDGKTVLIYNEEFDERLLGQTCEQDGVDMPFFRTSCVMREYSRYIGEWNDRTNEYRYQKLPGSKHDALGDCLATLEVIKHLASIEVVYQKESWIDKQKRKGNIVGRGIKFILKALVYFLIFIIVISVVIVRCEL